MPQSQEPQERRVAVRLASEQEAPCHFATFEKLEMCWAKVVDVSEAGIGLVLDRPLQMGHQIMVELPSQDLGQTQAVSACVVRLQSLSEGAWLIGCRFDQPLTEKEIQALV